MMGRRAITACLLWATLFTGVAFATSQVYPDSATSNTAAGTATITCTVPPFAQNGDKLIFDAWGTSNRTVTTPPTNFTLIGCDATNSNVEECVYYHDITGVEPVSYSLVWSGSQTHTSCNLTSIAGAHTGPPEVTDVKIVTGAASATNTSTITPLSNWDLMYQAVGTSEANGNNIAPQYAVSFTDYTGGPGPTFGGYATTSTVPSNTASVAQPLGQIEWLDTASNSVNWIFRTLLFAPASAPSTADQYLLPLREVADQGIGGGTGTTSKNCPDAQTGDIELIGFFWTGTQTVTPPAGFTQELSQTTPGEAGGAWQLTVYQHIIAGDAGNTVTWSWNNNQSFGFKEICLYNLTVSAPTDVHNFHASSPANGILNNNSLMTTTSANSVVVDFWVQDYNNAAQWGLNAVPLAYDLNDGSANQNIEVSAHVVQEPVSGGQWEGAFSSRQTNQFMWGGLAYPMGSPPSPVGAGTIKIRNVGLTHLTGFNCAGGGTKTPATHVLPWGTIAGDITEAWLDTGPNLSITAASPGWTQIQNSKNASNLSNNEATFYRAYGLNDFPAALWPKSGSDCWLGGTASLLNTAGLDTSCVTTGTSAPSMTGCSVTTTVNNDLVADSWIVSNTNDTSVTLDGGDTTLWNYGTDTVAAGWQYKATAGSYSVNATASNGSKQYTTTLTAWKPLSSAGSFFESIIQ